MMNNTTVVQTAMVSAMGSARKTAKYLVFKKCRQDIDKRNQQDDLSQQRQKQGGPAVAQCDEGLLAGQLGAKEQDGRHVYMDGPGAKRRWLQRPW